MKHKFSNMESQCSRHSYCFRSSYFSRLQQVTCFTPLKNNTSFLLPWTIPFVSTVYIRWENCQILLNELLFPVLIHSTNGKHKICMYKNNFLAILLRSAANKILDAFINQVQNFNIGLLEFMTYWAYMLFIVTNWCFNYGDSWVLAPPEEICMVELVNI